MIKRKKDDLNADDDTSNNDSDRGNDDAAIKIQMISLQKKQKASIL